MKDIVSQFAMQLTLAEKRELVAELKGAIAEELASRASGPAGPSRCPRCGSPSFVRKGRDRDGGQRWLVSVNVFFTIFTNVFSPIAPTRMHQIYQRGCAAFGA